MGRLNDLKARVSERWQPAHWTTIIGVLLVVSGFALVWLGWHGTTRLETLALQVPYAVSGGLAGLGLIGFGAAIINLQVTRHLGARERAHLRAVRGEVASILRHHQGTNVGERRSRGVDSP